MLGQGYRRVTWGSGRAGRWGLGTGKESFQATSSDRSLCGVESTEEAGKDSDDLPAGLQTRLSVFATKGGVVFLFVFEY